MTKRRLILFLLACGVLAAVLCAALRRPPDPIYNGRHLSDWVGQFKSMAYPDLRPGGPVDAIQHIGANGVPYLLQAISYEEPSWKQKLVPLLARISKPLAQRIERNLAQSQENATAAMLAFGHLGPQAECAIPQLGALLNGRHREQAGPRAAYVLGCIGNPAFDPLMNALTNHCLPTKTRWATTRAMGRVRARAAPAVPSLITQTKEQDPTLVLLSVQALGIIALEPATVVPALTDALRAARADVREAAAVALGKFGSQAKPAINGLLAALSDTTMQVRTAATNALLKIAPEALTNAPPK